MKWTLADGSVPSTRCERCQRPTPILVHGLGFDCCADQAIPAETLQADEADPAPTITLRFAIGLAVLATALIGAHAVWAANGMPVMEFLK